MPFSRPSFADLLQRIGAALVARFPGADVGLRQTPERALVAMMAAGSDEHLSYLDWQSRQLFPFSADTDYLEAWSGWRGIRRKGATGGTGAIAFANGSPGYAAEAGTLLQTQDGSIQVELTVDVAIDNTGACIAPANAVIPITATVGSNTNIGAGVVLTFVTTPPGFPDQGTVSTAFAGGDDAETDDELRLRAQRAYAQPSFGGNLNDWLNAALAVPGVSRCFASSASPTPGAVTLWPLFDGVRANGLPAGTDAWLRPGTAPSSGTGGAGDQLMVLNAVLATRPVCAALWVKALTAQPIALTIANLVVRGDPATVKAAILASLQAMLLAKFTALCTTIQRAWIETAIQQATGVVAFDLTVPAGDVAVAAGNLPVIGVITDA
jgi:uncharacterized phage protein gp47/JayE